ncbi:nucleoside monophosphate kinase [Patescibacteria group bacterium]|nr:nucleoside monophosphate kinase [Patescibacteria group bacterium]MBU1890351.1 nucleoside monophosphate kinase [Patescibacteria group bacterium]
MVDSWSLKIVMVTSIPKLIIIMGPPGSGKGTQAQLLKEKYSCNYIATGDLVREMYKKAATGDPLGLEVKKRYDRGEPQPDDIILKFVRQKLITIDTQRGIIFDAFPLSEAQARGLDEIIKDFKLDKPVAINIKVGEEDVVQRLSLRKYCPKDNSVYYPKSPTYDSNKCEKCGKGLIRRADDEAGVVRKRYKKYIDRINVLVMYYEKRNQLISINGEQSVEKVASEIEQRLSTYQSDYAQK